MGVDWILESLIGSEKCMLFHLSLVRNHRRIFKEESEMKQFSLEKKKKARGKLCGRGDETGGGLGDGRPAERTWSNRVRLRRCARPAPGPVRRLDLGKRQT